LRVRSFNWTDLFWVDAICINQEDSRERSQQVKLMAAIYRSALSVCAWLGEEDEHTSRGFSLIRTLALVCVDTGRHKRVESLKYITPRLL
jgi:heterokaryon incompatibility protein (HET)